MDRLIGTSALMGFRLPCFALAYRRTAGARLGGSDSSNDVDYGFPEQVVKAMVSSSARELAHAAVDSPACRGRRLPGCDASETIRDIRRQRGATDALQSVFLAWLPYGCPRENFPSTSTGVAVAAVISIGQVASLSERLAIGWTFVPCPADARVAAGR